MNIHIYVLKDLGMVLGGGGFNEMFRFFLNHLFTPYLRK